MLGGKRLINDMDKLMQRTAVDEFCAILECLVSSMGQSQINANNSNLVYFLLGEWKLWALC